MIGGWRGIVLGGLVGLSACTPALDWREIRPEQAPGFQATFPCRPDHVSRPVTLSSMAQPVLMHMWSCQTGDITWAVSQVRAHDVTEVEPTLTTLARTMHNNLSAASVLAGDTTPVQELALGAVKVPGMTPQAQSQAWRFQARRVDARGRPLEVVVTAWHFSHGLQVFQASVTQPMGAEGVGTAQDVASPFWGGLQFPG